jgi:lipoprotein-releasing system ATP-binding protein
MTDPASSNRMIVRVENVQKKFVSEAGTQTVLDGLNWSMSAGDAATIVGPSGCGKSTLLNLVGALDRPTSGQIWIDGADLNSLDEDALADLRARKIGFIFQEHHLLPQCTARENILLPALAIGSATDQAILDRADSLLDRVGLTEHAAKQPHQLSGGQRQRVAVVRALINEPLVLLADEPTGSLDRAAAETLIQLLIELNQEKNLTLVVVTHSKDISQQIGRTYELRDGRFTDETSP